MTRERLSQVWDTWSKVVVVVTALACICALGWGVWNAKTVKDLATQNNKLTKTLIVAQNRHHHATAKQQDEIIAQQAQLRAKQLENHALLEKLLFVENEFLVEQTSLNKAGAEQLAFADYLARSEEAICARVGATCGSVPTLNATP